MTTPMQISVEELKARLDRGEKVFILDVREPWEFQTANLGGKLIPLGDLPHGLNELDPEMEIVTICHHGVRSMRAVAFLRQNGFAKATNLAGGIDRYSAVDPKVPRY